MSVQQYDDMMLAEWPSVDPLESTSNGAHGAPQHAGGAYARATDPSTSWEAAATVNVGKWEWVALEALRDSPDGLTILECVEETGAPMQSLSPRFAQLRRKGLTTSDGKRRNRTTGTLAEVHRLTEKGACFVADLANKPKQCWTRPAINTPTDAFAVIEKLRKADVRIVYLRAS